MTTIKIAKVHALDVNVAAFSQEVNDFIYSYGLRQILNDAGSSGKSPDEKLGMAQKKLDALYAGTLKATRQAGTGKSGKDAVEAELDKMARAKLKVWLAGKASKMSDHAEPKVKQWLQSLREKYEGEWRPIAEAAVASRDAAGDDMDDLLDL